LYALAATLVKVMIGEAPPKANDRTMGDPWQPLAGRGEIKARYSDLFLQNLDRALRLPIEDRWQDTKGWMDALVVGSRHGVRHGHPVNETSRFETILPKPPGKRGRWIAISAMTVLLAATGWHFMRGDFTVGEEEMPTPAWGALVITSEPPGARLMDTRGTPLGTTPIELKGLDGGLSWEGILEMDGYLVSKVAADVAAGETKPVPTVELKPKPQKVIVSSEPSGAAVLEGDEVLGVTPLELPEIPPGTKLVYQLELDGYEAMEVSGEVKVGNVLLIDGNMKEKPKPSDAVSDLRENNDDGVTDEEQVFEEQSLQSYLNLAASGDSESMWKIGRIYDEGINVPVDRSLALEWYKKSADNGSVEGMFLYALCNELGTGTAVNMKTALHYYKLALENEHEEARRRYTSLVGGMEPSVEKGVESIIESD
jgi:hypothetical protein